MRKTKALIKAEKRIKELETNLTMSSTLAQIGGVMSRQAYKANNILMEITPSAKITELLAELHDLRKKEVKT